MKRWAVYLVRCRDGSLYTGMTNDLDQRLMRHNAGTGAKYTRSRRPVVLVHTETFRTETRARKREAEIKKLTKPQKETLVRTTA